MSVLFDNVKVGDTVHYSTPQGQSGKGKVVIHKGTHLVLNAGGKHGRPQVVTDKNYIKHSRGGKVVGALLSRLKEDKALVAKHQEWMKAQEKKRSDKAWEKVHADKPGIITRLVARSKGTKLNKQGKVVEARQDISDPYNWDPVMRAQIFAAAAKENRARQIKKGQPVPHELDKGRTLKSKPAPFRRGVAEDNKDVGGAAERIAKTKKHRKKLHELDNSTLASYVTKALKDRKTSQSGFEMAGRIHTGARLKHFQDKAFARISKRTKGIQTAVGKIANNLPAEPLKAHADSEGSKHGGWQPHVRESAAPGKEAWIKANKQRFIDRYGKEKGLRVLYAKAWKDSKTNEARESEYTANMHMAQSVGKTPKGHYLMRDGRKLSGPHTPDEAVKAYKGLASQGTDTKGVKIVHVKEGVETDVTSMLMEDKVKKAAEKAISLAKKAKGNKHVDTKPSLDIADKGGGGPMGGSHEDSEGEVNAKV